MASSVNHRHVPGLRFAEQSKLLAELGLDAAEAARRCCGGWALAGCGPIWH
jgi:hypothetical protein